MSRSTPAAGVGAVLAALASLVLVAVAAQLAPARAGGGSWRAWPERLAAAERRAGEDLTLGLDRLPATAQGVLQAVIAGVLLAVIVVLARRLARIWRDHRRGVRLAAEALGRPVPGGPVSQDVRDALAEAAKVAAEDLEVAVVAGGGDASDAVIRAWVRVEEVAAQAGHRRREADTATEFTAGLLRLGMTDAAPVGTLLRIYGAARFGSVPVPVDDVARARRAFQEVHRSLAGRSLV